jgi:hypothetical protein
MRPAASSSTSPQRAAAPRRLNTFFPARGSPAPPRLLLPCAAEPRAVSASPPGDNPELLRFGHQAAAPRTLGIFTGRGRGSLNTGGSTASARTAGRAKPRRRHATPPEERGPTTSDTRLLPRHHTRAGGAPTRGTASSPPRRAAPAASGPDQFPSTTAYKRHAARLGVAAVRGTARFSSSRLAWRSPPPALLRPLHHAVTTHRAGSPSRLSPAPFLQAQHARGVPSASAAGAATRWRGSPHFASHGVAAARTQQAAQGSRRRRVDFRRGKLGGLLRPHLGAAA